MHNEKPIQKNPKSIEIRNRPSLNKNQHTRLQNQQTPMQNKQPPMQNHHRIPVKCETMKKRNKKKRNGIYQNKPKLKRNETN